MRARLEIEVIRPVVRAPLTEAAPQVRAEPTGSPPVPPGSTGSELAAKGKITVKVHVPKAGKLSGKMTAATTTLGSGKTTAHKAGDVKLTITFTSAGKAYLNAHNGQAIKVKVTCVFKPNARRRAKRGPDHHVLRYGRWRLPRE